MDVQIFLVFGPYWIIVLVENLNDHEDSLLEDLTPTGFFNCSK